MVKLKRERRESIEDKKGIKWKQEHRKYKRRTKRDMKKSGKKKKRERDKSKQRNKCKDTKWSEQTSWNRLLPISASLFNDAVNKRAHVHLSVSGHVPFSNLTIQLRIICFKGHITSVHNWPLRVP
jgi:hypothetical protein